MTVVMGRMHYPLPFELMAVAQQQEILDLHSRIKTYEQHMEWAIADLRRRLDAANHELQSLGLEPK